MSKRLVIMRGLPWCGKSYTALDLLTKFRAESPCNIEDGEIFSTDEYFYTEVKPNKPNEYSFDMNLLGRAHRWNQERAAKAMYAGNPLVIIDNTNTTLKEPMPYVEVGYVEGYTIEVQEPTSDRWKTIRELLLDKNKNRKALQDWAKKLAEGSKETHNVPVEAIERMMSRWTNNLTAEELIAHLEI
jgi:hypothetical protein